MPIDLRDTVNTRLARLTGTVFVWPNAIALVDRPTSQTVTDTQTGNILPVFGRERMLLSLRRDSAAGNPQIIENPSSQGVTEILRGYTVHPFHPPKSFAAAPIIDAFVDGRRGKGLFTMRADSTWRTTTITGSSCYFYFSRGQNFSPTQTTPETAPYAITSVSAPCIAEEAIAPYTLVMLSGVSANQQMCRPLHISEPRWVYRVIGMTTTAIAPGATFTPTIQGQISNPAWAWTVGQVLYISSTGTLTATRPTGTVIWPVAIALSATTINFFLGFPEQYDD